MCGIAGLARSEGVRYGDGESVKAMLASISHRGPDDEHQLDVGHAILGARRLAIIDLNTGRQPLTTADGLVSVANNGEIYNYVELRRELAAEGHAFRTEGDTEVIAVAYQRWGLDFLPRLRGMFALSLWDEREKVLILARDRLGKKPLHYLAPDRDLMWGSELKAVLAEGSAPRQIDEEALALYLRYQYVPAPKSIYRAIRKLEPASYLVWTPDHIEEPRKYWAVAYEPKAKGSIEESESRLEALLTESVELRLRSDVPVGIFLSGGIDSSIVTAIAASKSPQPLRTFSIGFSDRSFDEREAARIVAQQFGTVHTDEVVDIDAIGALPDLAFTYDEPFADSSALPTYRVAQLASQSVKVVLTGDGGDESFAGYRRYGAMSVIDRVQTLPRPVVAGAKLATLGLTRYGPFTRARNSVARGWSVAEARPQDRYLALVSIFDGTLVTELLGHDGTEVYLSAVIDERLGRTDRLLRADLLTYLPEDLLVKMDRATMAHGLEARSPLLDHAVVEYAASLPEEFKLRGRASKILLRRLARRRLPAAITRRPKMGFGVPIDAWFDGDLGGVLYDLLTAREYPAQHLVNPNVGLRLLAEHRTGVRRHGPRLWSLLFLETWARRWLPAAVGAAA